MRHATLALPLVFLAMHNKVEMTSNEVQAPSPHLIWEELWSEVTPGMCIQFSCLMKNVSQFFYVCLMKTYLLEVKRTVKVKTC